MHSPIGVKEQCRDDALILSVSIYLYASIDVLFTRRADLALAVV